VSDTRYELAAYIGPCTQEEAEELAEAILNLPEFDAVGGAVGMRRVDPDDPLFAEAVA
jgi:hypothetical protein